MLNLSDITHCYKGNSDAVLSSVNLTLEPGEVVGLIGKNGAGKTTLSKIAALLLKPNSGSYTIDGKDAFISKKYLKDNLNMVLGGEDSLFPELSVIENLIYYAGLAGISRSQAKMKARDILNTFELEDKANAKISQLSRGMKQRLQIGRGLVNSPKYLILDEPTLGMDFDISITLHNYIEKLKNQGTGIILTTHNLLEAESLCDRFYILSHGKISTQGLLSELELENTNRYKYNVVFDSAESARKFSLNLDESVPPTSTNTGYEVELSSDDLIDKTIMDIIYQNNLSDSFVRIKSNEAGLRDVLIDA